MKTFLDDLKILAAKKREKNFLKERQERFKDKIINLPSHLSKIASDSTTEMGGRYKNFFHGVQHPTERWEGKYHWTWHAREKIRFYNLSPSRVTRIIRFPARVEDGVAPNTLAGMQPAGTKKYQEIWVMWQKKCKMKNAKCKMKDSGTIKIISAWRYPGKSPARNPIPKEILDEVRGLLS